MSRKNNVVNGRVRRLRALTVVAKTGVSGSIAFLHHGFIFQMIASSFATGTRKQNDSRVARPQALHSGNCPRDVVMQGTGKYRRITSQPDSTLNLGVFNVYLARSW